MKHMCSTVLFLANSLRSKNSYLRTTLIYLLERMLWVALSFAVYTALARTYGPALMGSYSYVQTIMQVVPFLLMGTEGVIIREYVRAGPQKGELMGSAFLILSTTSLVATLAPVGAIWLLQRDQALLVHMAAFSAIGFLPTGLLVTELALKAERDAAPILAARLSSSLLGASTKLCLIYLHVSIEWVALATSLESLVLMLLLLCFYQRKRSVLTWRFGKSRARFIFKQCYPAMLASVAVMLFFRSNQLLLVYLAGYEAVGQYAIAFQTSQLFLVLPTVFFGAIYPRLVYLHAHDAARYRAVLNMCYYGFAVTGYLILLSCLIFGHALFEKVFGTRYELASRIIVIFAIANLFSFSGAVRGRAIDIANSTHYHAWIAVLGLAIVVPASWLSIPTYGALGAAISVVGALFVFEIGTSFFLPAVRKDAIVQIKALLLIPSFKLSDII